MTERSLRFRVGLFVLVILCLLGGLVVLFGGYPTVLKRHQHYTVVLSDAAGLASGTPVRRSGVRIGEVQALRLDDASGRVLVGILVEQPHVLHKSDHVALVRSLIGGDATLDFTAEGDAAGQAPAEPDTEFVAQDQGRASPFLPQGELVPGLQATMQEFNKSAQQINKLLPEVQAALKEYRDLAKDAHALLPEVKKTNDEFQAAGRSWNKAGDNITAAVTSTQERLAKSFDNLNEAATRFGRTFSDENQRNLTEALKNFRAGTTTLEGVMKNLDDLAKDSRQTLQSVDQVFRILTAVVGNLDKASQPWAERSANIARNLDEGAVGFNRTFSDWRQLFRGLGDADGSLKMLLNDATLYHSLNDAACMLARILPRADRVLRDMEIFADKVARHPEILGATGLFQPSTGLKK